MRQRLPNTRASVTHKLVITTATERIKLFVVVGMYPDGRPGELFLTLKPYGSSIQAWAQAWACAMSIALQHGAGIEGLAGKFAYWRFEPEGWTEANQHVKSVVDAIARWLLSTYAVDSQSLLDCISWANYVANHNFGEQQPGGPASSGTHPQSEEPSGASAGLPHLHTETQTAKETTA